MSRRAHRVVETVLFITAVAFSLTTFGSSAAGPPPKTAMFVLDNGLRVYVQEDHRLPLVAMTMAFAAGGSREKPGTYGFAHLFEHLMFLGTAHADKTKQDGLLSSLGALQDATT